jgi:hypothetical protein
LIEQDVDGGGSKMNCRQASARGAKGDYKGPRRHHCRVDPDPELFGQARKGVEDQQVDGSQFGPVARRVLCQRVEHDVARVGLQVSGGNSPM